MRRLGDRPLVVPHLRLGSKVVIGVEAEINGHHWKVTSHLHEGSFPQYQYRHQILASSTYSRRTLACAPYRTRRPVTPSIQRQCQILSSITPRRTFQHLLDHLHQVRALKVPKSSLGAVKPPRIRSCLFARQAQCHRQMSSHVKRQ